MLRHFPQPQPQLPSLPTYISELVTHLVSFRQPCPNANPSKKMLQNNPKHTQPGGVKHGGSCLVPSLRLPYLQCISQKSKTSHTCHEIWVIDLLYNNLKIREYLFKLSQIGSDFQLLALSIMISLPTLGQQGHLYLSTLRALQSCSSVPTSSPPLVSTGCLSGGQNSSKSDV